MQLKQISWVNSKEIKYDKVSNLTHYYNKDLALEILI